MRREQEPRARGFLARGLLFSLLAHINVIAPLALVIWVWAAREEARRAEEVDVAFEDASTANLPEDLPPLEPPPPDALDTPPPPKLDPRRLKLAQAGAARNKKPDTQPEPEIVVPPLPPVPEVPPPPPEPRTGHQKMVELETNKDVEPPPDAKFLAEKNSRAEVETRARDTNLEKSQQGDTPASSPSAREDIEVGADKEKIAELDDQKSALGRKAPDVTPHTKPELAASERPEKKSLLALRDPSPRTHELTPETADPSLPKQADGDLSRPERNVRGPKTDPSSPGPGKNVKLALSAHDYEMLFGADAEAERRLAQKQRSTKLGRGDQRRARVQAALENFIPEVKPGNVTSLNARGAPFAAFIARMHRTIHKHWGFGALEDWDELSGSSPLNNPNLLTTLEIVLDRDGTVDKVTVVRASGYLPYDAAAIDVAYTAGPYPDPPRGLRSGNGKIYVHWRFYRDDRQCATSGVDYYVLDNAPSGGDRGDGPAVPDSHDPTPGSPAAASGGGGGGSQRRLERLDRGHHQHTAGGQRLEPEVESAGEAPAQGQSAGQTQAASEPAAAPSRAPDPAARAVAERWFKALAGGEEELMADMAVLPFKTGGKEVGKRAALESMLHDLARESAGADRRSPLQVYTTAGLRGAIGKLPPNLDDGSGEQLYAVAASGPHDVLILILGQRGGRWRPLGLMRR